MKRLVLLAGCGLGDGSCIEEVVLTYAALDKYHCEYTPAAEDIVVPSVDHVTERQGEPRNLLREAARIGRGRICELGEVALGEYDALLIPGGIGLLANCGRFRMVSDIIGHFLSRKKPVGTMCAGIDFLRGILGAELLQDSINGLSATDFCCDPETNVFYTPAFRKTGNCYDVLQGIDAMICAMEESLK